jgi:phosphoglycerate dehydrogenase-like enzyme
MSSIRVCHLSAQLSILAYNVARSFQLDTMRGPVVDGRALTRALQDEQLAGAALDVWEEPVAANNPLLKMDNAIATPPAAYFSSPAVAQMPRRCGEEVARRRIRTGTRTSSRNRKSRCR